MKLTKNRKRNVGKLSRVKSKPCDVHTLRTIRDGDNDSWHSVISRCKQHCSRVVIGQRSNVSRRSTAVLSLSNVYHLTANNALLIATADNNALSIIHLDYTPRLYTPRTPCIIEKCTVICTEYTRCKKVVLQTNVLWFVSVCSLK